MVKAVAEPERLTPAAAAIGHVLRHDDAGDGRIDIDDAAGMVLVHAERLAVALRRR